MPDDERMRDLVRLSNEIIDEVIAEEAAERRAYEALHRARIRLASLFTCYPED